jgi:hypothetical protein
MDTMEFKIVLQSAMRKFTGNSHQEILKRLLAWMRENNEPSRPGEDRDYWLNRIKNQAVDIERQKLKQKRVPKLGEAWHAGLALVRQGMGKTVDQLEHNRRAKICQTCPLRGDVSTCMGCGGASKLSSLISSMSKIVSAPIVVDRTVKSKYCNACGCSLALLSVTTLDSLPKEDPVVNRARPLQCWMRVGGRNYLGKK